MVIASHRITSTILFSAPLTVGEDCGTRTPNTNHTLIRSRYRFTVAVLLISVAVLATLYIDLVSRHSNLERDYAATIDEEASLSAKLSQIERLLDVDRGPNEEYASPNLLLTYSYWFNYYFSNDSNRTSGKPYVCLYVPDDNSTVEINVDSNRCINEIASHDPGWNA